MLAFEEMHTSGEIAREFLSSKIQPWSTFDHVVVIGPMISKSQARQLAKRITVRAQYIHMLDQQKR